MVGRPLPRAPVRRQQSAAVCEDCTSFAHSRRCAQRTARPANRACCSPLSQSVAGQCLFSFERRAERSNCNSEYRPKQRQPRPYNGHPLTEKSSPCMSFSVCRGNVHGFQMWQEKWCTLATKHPMTCRYAHRRIATLFTLVQAVPAARVIDWPQPSQDKRSRAAHEELNKSAREVSDANK